MGFEKFVPRTAASKATPQVTIRKSGLISFDGAAVQEFELERATHLVLFFDKGRKLLGIQKTNDAKTDGAIPISRRRRTVSVKVPPFFESWGFLLDDMHKLDVKYDESLAMMVVDLSGIQRRRGRRPKR
jgi:hypothetical protein